ncbi:hypothetical protein KDN34_04350 [Shewanella yunxiaonensis]|uniref:DUF3325 domain-containing protein n=1 Tax=Shewanella yunxiaonensis TaxID=2829809 RepID=A0ABX7YVE6_9GAMM|nr:hypothetical protein [Shewanella yunxiaonensis]QUN06687.1 hypothetical protein KDN34_04350 [Shewanella yunxiaonensis]
MMIWFVCSLIVACLLLVTVETRLTPEADGIHMPGLASLNPHKAWLLLPLAILCWLSWHLFTTNFSFFSLAAIGFVATPLTMLIPRWRYWVLPSALLSMISVLLGTIWG